MTKGTKVLIIILIIIIIIAGALLAYRFYLGTKNEEDIICMFGKYL